MIKKDFVNTEQGHDVRVTFTLPSSVWADTIYLVGDFNEWHRTAHPLQRNRQGDWYIVLSLKSRHAYQFRYLCDNQHWMNDSDADAYVPNPHGSDNSLVVTDPEFEHYHGEGWQPEE